MSHKNKDNIALLHTATCLWNGLFCVKKYCIACTNVYSMVWCEGDVTPLLTYLSCISFASFNRCLLTGFDTLTLMHTAYDLIECIGFEANKPTWVCLPPLLWMTICPLYDICVLRWYFNGSNMYGQIKKCINCMFPSFTMYRMWIYICNGSCDMFFFVQQ